MALYRIELTAAMPSLQTVPRDDEQPATVADLERLERRVEDVENVSEALSLLPQRVTYLREDVQGLREQHRAADAREERRIRELHERLEKLAGDMHERFDKVDEAHDTSAATAGKLDVRGVLATALACATAIGVPIAVALITSGP